MGRPRAARRRRRGEVAEKAGVLEEEHDNEDINPHAEGFYRDEVEEFHAEREKIMLDQSGFLEPASSTDEEPSDGEEEILGLDLSGSEEEGEVEGEGEEEGDEGEEGEGEEGEGEGEEESESGEEFKLPQDLRKFYASDDEFEEEDQPPELSAKAWGRHKRTFYSTDYVADELGGSSEGEGAEEEEREALAIQQRMAASLSEHDFQAPDITGEDDAGAKEEVTKGEEERVIQDLSKLSRDEKLALLEKDSPELFELLEEFREKFLAVVESLYPLVEVARGNPARFTRQGAEYLEVKLHLYLCYCVNIMFYLRLKSCKSAVHNHPVIDRIVQIRQLIAQLESLDEKLEPQVREAIESISGESTRPEEPLTSGGSTRPEEPLTRGGSAETARKRKKHQSAVPGRKKAKKLSEVLESEEGGNPPTQGVPEEEDGLAYYERVKKEKREMKRAREEAWKRKLETARRAAEESDVEEEGDEGKRAITYQIARNKGLTPKRKKEQRNPRVKHRKRYQKALIKRKSQVRPVVSELDRYGGEQSGIRTHLARSVKIII